MKKTGIILLGRSHCYIRRIIKSLTKAAKAPEDKATHRLVMEAAVAVKFRWSWSWSLSPVSLGTAESPAPTQLILTGPRPDDADITAATEADDEGNPTAPSVSVPPAPLRMPSLPTPGIRGKEEKVIEVHVQEEAAEQEELSTGRTIVQEAVRISSKKSKKEGGRDEISPFTSLLSLLIFPNFELCLPATCHSKF